MTAPAIRLDRSKVYSECRGERTPDDPHYQVHFWQGGKVGDKIVLLPFDAQGMLVPDDGKIEPYPGTNADGKSVEFKPLYNKDMRDLLDRKMKRLKGAAKPADDELDEEGTGDGEADPLKDGSDVNLESWLRGEAQYQPHMIRTAVKARYHLTIQNLKDIVIALVLDEKLVPENQVSPALGRYLPGKAA